MSRIILVVMLALLVGCSTTQVDLKYSPPATALVAPENARTVSLARISDERGEAPTWLGAIRADFGTPIKKLVATRPVAEMLGSGLVGGLKARKYTVIDANGEREIATVIHQLSCNQFARRSASVEIELTVYDATNGTQRFTKIFESSESESPGLGGYWASPEDLAATMRRTFRQAIDKALDDPGLRNALK